MAVEVGIFLGILVTGILGFYFGRFSRILNRHILPFILSLFNRNKPNFKNRYQQSTDVEKNTVADTVDAPIVQNKDYRYQWNPNLHYLQRVRYLDGGMYRCGVVEWTGRRTIDGLDIVIISTNETFQNLNDYGNLAREGQPLAELSHHECPEGYRILSAREVEKIDSFELGDYCFVRKTEVSKSRDGGFLRKKFNESFVIHKKHRNFKQLEDYEHLSAEDYQLVKVPPPESETVSEYVKPITGIETEMFSGRNKGIQGKNNSCYLDSLLFSLFAYSDAFDGILTADDDGKSSEYLEILNIIRFQIVYPLRAHQFVSHHHVQQLRQSIAKQVRNDNYLSETRDISECLDILFGTLLNVPPLVYIGDFVGDKVYFNGVFAIELFDDGSIQYPTTDDLLRHSAVSMQFCLKEMTDYLFMQIAREDGNRVNVFPSINIDLKDLCYGTLKICTKCSCQATMQFWNASRDVKGTYFCDDCARENNLSQEEGLKLPEVDMTNIPEEKTVLTLTGVLCIERSHFNCFVRCGATDNWVFFDSMKDQQKIYNLDENREEAVNIPLVMEIPDFQKWLETAQRELKSNRTVRPYHSSLSGDDFDIALRIFSYPSFFIYRRI